MQKYSEYIKRAQKLGAKEVEMIAPKSIVTAEWVRYKCRFGCDGYGQTLMCPPHSPTAHETRQVLDEYKHALLIHGDEDTDIDEIVVRLEKKLFLDGYYKAFSMGAGPCMRCKECAEVCRHAEEARPSMEACGIDVYATARAHGLPIKVLKTQNCKGNYYGVVLIE